MLIAQLVCTLTQPLSTQKLQHIGTFDVDVIAIDFILKIEWVIKSNLKIGQQIANLQANMNILANGCILEQNARKETPIKIQFYFQDNITLPTNTFSKAWLWHWCFFMDHFHSIFYSC